MLVAGVVAGHSANRSRRRPWCQVLPSLLHFARNRPHLRDHAAPVASTEIGRSRLQITNQGRAGDATRCRSCRHSIQGVAGDTNHQQDQPRKGGKRHWGFQ
ncbi:uncharacterized protein LOC106754962 [Vigna radiata var. radiata]|uniref:Uncharacterized protein LOC106754962 n=1 Tax=Vigna radiata var. radiata TaxID=3916 RepID=A0A1S3TFK9_VIGRR|nr:uncharacterized protein LOC106754962 [Vigna radiata var. radiata]